MLKVEVARCKHEPVLEVVPLHAQLLPGQVSLLLSHEVDELVQLATIKDAERELSEAV